MSNTNKAARINRNRQAASGVTKHLTASLTVDGTAYTPVQMATILTDPATKADATTAATAAFHSAVAAETSSTATANAVFLAVKKLALVTFASQPEVLADFGLEAPHPKTPSAATKAEAVVKRAATRKASEPSAPAAPVTPKA